MKTIYKYALPAGGAARVPLPHNFKKLHLGLDPSNLLCMWAEVDTEEPLEDWIIQGVGTGWPLDDMPYFTSDECEYMGTINDGIYYMWHYYGRKMTEKETEYWNSLEKDWPQ